MRITSERGLFKSSFPTKKFNSKSLFDINVLSTTITSKIPLKIRFFKIYPTVESEFKYNIWEDEINICPSPNKFICLSYLSFDINNIQWILFK